MTEDEAKTKWCPFVRLVDERTHLGAANRISTIDDGTGVIYGSTCIASACMAWRVKETLLGPADAARNGSMFGREGYCGLAGKP